METGLFQNGGRLAALAKSAGYDAEKLALLYGRSPRQFRRIFEQDLGRSPRQWLTELKVAKAGSDLLAHKPVKQIASELGYNYPSAFCRWFRKATGLRPTEYVMIRNHPARTAVQNVRFW